ncbi:ANK2 [Symbiodinium natans]|uniref:ANK2 protein n=1 Tax=Symbiodinium natans TaxID=878477 RepID=A0A812T8S4_9DINO|nr:ANK2 [Symbiodinium natans]
MARAVWKMLQAFNANILVRMAVFSVLALAPVPWQLDEPLFLGAIEGRQLRESGCTKLPQLPLPCVGLIADWFPQPDNLRTSLATLEQWMRALPLWEPIQEKDILPAAESMPDGPTLTKRRNNAALLAAVTIGFFVFLAELAVVFLNRIPVCLKTSCGTGSNRQMGMQKGDPPKDVEAQVVAPEGLSDTTPLISPGQGPAAASSVKYEMELGPGKTAIFLVYYIIHNTLLLALTSWSMRNGLMSSGLGLDWEVLWFWLVTVLAVDVVGYTIVSIQATWINHIVPHPAGAMLFSVLPILGPRVDLLKDCLFVGAVFQLAVCAESHTARLLGMWFGNLALITIFAPAPLLMVEPSTRRDLAREFLAALVARLKEAPQPVQQAPKTDEQDGKSRSWCSCGEAPKTDGQEEEPRRWCLCGKEEPKVEQENSGKCCTCSGTEAWISCKHAP